MRRRVPGLQPIALASVSLTFVALTASRFYVDPRFLSFLLVPLFMYAAAGGSALLTRPFGRWQRDLALAYLGLFGVLLVALFLAVVPAAITTPYEATRDAARAITAVDPQSTIPVLVNMHEPSDLGTTCPDG